MENFQSHQDTSIQFDQGLNVIVGQSDSGKTAVLRGLRWALFNLPRGTDFLKVGADFVRVTVTLTNGTKIVRERTSSKNRYKIQALEQDELVLEGFGTQSLKKSWMRTKCVRFELIQIMNGSFKSRNN
ncbi:DNA double-strand break repair Rad50 ATPase [Bacillus sp. JCM 19045]|nr:DNA double-strand break repair Rad50 ATPase [Bacillus sp. JCM 19045]